MWWKCLLCGIGGLIIGGIIMQEMDRKALEEAYAAIKKGEASVDKMYNESMEILAKSMEIASEEDPIIRMEKYTQILNKQKR